MEAPSLLPVCSATKYREWQAPHCGLATVDSGAMAGTVGWAAVALCWTTGLAGNN